jgi:alpha-galactosidase
MTSRFSTDFLEFQLTPSSRAWSVASRRGPEIVLPRIRMSAEWRSAGRRFGWDGSLEAAAETATRTVGTAQGEAQSLLLRLPPASPGVEIEIEWRLPARTPLVLWRARLRNQSGQAIEAGRIELLHVGNDRSAAPSWEWGGPPDDLAFYSNGWQSWSWSGALSPGDHFPRTRLGPLSSPLRVNPGTPHPRRRGRFSADFYGVLGSRRARAGVLVGFLSQRQAFGSLEARLDRREPGMRLWANGDGARLDPGQTLETDWACLQFVDIDAADPLGPFLDAVASENGARVQAPTPVGWCSWYYFFQEVTEGDIRDAASWAERHRPQAPLSLIQIDDGFEAEVGDWFETNSRFSGGLSALQAEIRGAGLQPGLWLAPFIAKPGAAVVREHPEWVLRGPGGRPANAGFLWNTRTRALDLSHPGVLEHLDRLIGTAKREWGFDYLKLDFLYAGALAGKRYDPRITRAQALHQGLAAIRRAAGEDAVLVGCGCPIGSGIGIFDAMRISSDVAPRWNPAYLGIEPFFRSEPDFPSTRNAIRNILTRAHLHRRWWINDPDCLLLREQPGPRLDRPGRRTPPKASQQHLTIPEIQCLATAIALSGGSLIVSDDLSELASERVAWLARLLPPLPGAAQVRDWFDVAYASRLILPLEGAVGRWVLAAVLNWADEANDMAADLDSLGVKMGAPIHMVDFWQGGYWRLDSPQVGPVRIPPHGVSLVALREATPPPQWLGDTLHVSQGLVVDRWEPASSGLTAELSLGHQTAGKAFLALPAPPSSVTLDGAPVSWTDRGRDVYELAIAMKARSILRVQWR